MDKIGKLVVVLILAVGGWIGVSVFMGNAKDGSYESYIRDVMGPNNPTTQSEQLILEKGQEMGFEVDPASVKVVMGQPEVSDGPVAGKISSTITTNMVKVTGTVTYERQVVPGWKKTVTLTESKKFVHSSHVNKTR